MSPFLLGPFLGLLALPVVAQSAKLNGPLARGVEGELSFPPQTSPDGRFHVYTADRDGDHAFELYSVPAGGGDAPRRLAGPVSEYAYWSITKDGSSVLFVAAPDGSGELATVPIDGSAPPRVLGTGVSSFQQSQGGTRILYIANQDSPAAWELFSMPIDGGVPVKLNGPLAEGGSVESFVLSNDARVLFSVNQGTELFVAPIDGGAPARELPVPLVAGGSVVLFQFSPDGSRVFYEADQEEDERFEIFSLASDGSEPPRGLNGPLVPGGDVGVLITPRPPCPQAQCVPYFYPSFSVSLDGQWVVYTANQDAVERFELYSVPADGSRPAQKLSASPDQDVAISSLTYDSAWVLYQKDPSFPSELFSVPIDGAAPARRISRPLPNQPIFFPQVSFDSRFVVYQAAQDEWGVIELYSAPVDGSAQPVKLNAPLPVGGDVGGTRYFPGFWVLPGGVAYQADQEQDGLPELYCVPVVGGVLPRKLATGPIDLIYPSFSYLPPPFTLFDEILFRRGRELVSVGIGDGARPILLDELSDGAVVGDVEAFALAPAGDRAVYQALEQDDLTAELFAVPTDKPSQRVRILPTSQTLPVSSPRLVPDGSRALFLRARSLEFYEPGTDLYSAATDGSAAPITLTAPLGPDVSVLEFEIAPDGRRVVFQVLGANRYSLYVALVDGSGAPILLHAAQQDFTVLGGPKISADGSRVAFLESSTLRAVPIDGSAPALLVMDLVNSDFQLACDGSLVVFRRSVGQRELFVAPTDGSSAPRRLNAPLQNRGRVHAFALAPDATRAVYLADQTVDEMFELYSARIDGSAQPVRLHEPLAAGRDVVAGFQIASDGQRVVYRADALVDEVLDLFSVPLDASRPPVRLNASLVAGGDVLDFQVSPDGQRVVYRADQETDEAVELYSTSIRGARGGVKLSRTLVPGGDVRSFQLSADSRTVAFTAERNAARALTLLAAPIGGRQKAVEVAGPFEGTGSVVDYRLSADGTAVVYRADQEVPGVVELYASRCSGTRAASQH